MEDRQHLLLTCFDKERIVAGLLLYMAFLGVALSAKYSLLLEDNVESVCSTAACKAQAICYIALL